jgi:hypothetical protein
MISLTNLHGQKITLIINLCVNAANKQTDRLSYISASGSALRRGTYVVAGI